MPYLTDIGPHVENQCKLGSRGYHVYRRGKTVIAVWGQVRHVPGKMMKVYWVYTRSVQKKFRTEKMARGYLSKRLDALTNKGYERHGIGVKILPARRVG